MKNKPFHFRYVNEIVGVFVLLVIVLLVAAVIVAGRAQGWFEQTHEIPIDFPPEGSLELQVGSPVQILETTVGRVLDIEADENGFMTATILIKGDFYQFVRSDSIVTVKRKFGVFGDAYVHISKGKGPELPEGAGLVANPDVDLMDIVLDLINQVRDATLDLLESATKVVDETVGFAADLRSPDSSVQQSLRHVEDIINQIKEGKGSIGRFTTNEETAERLDAILDEFAKMVSDIEKVLEDVSKTTSGLPEMAKVIEGEVRDIPGTVAIAQETVRETERLIEGVQNHWLLRDYVPPDHSTPLIRAYDIPRKAPDPQAADASAKENES